MSQPFEIDTDALGRAEGPFEDLSSRLTSLADQIQQNVRALGECWGDDESGRGFAAQYGPARDQLLTGVRNTADVVRSTSDGVRTMAQGFGRTEASNTEATEGLLRHARAAADSPTPTSEGQATHRDAALPMQPLTSMVHGTPTTPGVRHAATPRMFASRMDSATEATPGARLEPTETYAARTDAVQGMPVGRAEPAEFMPARTESVQGVPAGRLEPAEITPARAHVMPASTAERAEPTEIAPTRVDMAPATPALRAEVVQGAPMERSEPAVGRDATPGVPAERLEPAESYSARMDAVPALPAIVEQPPTARDA